MQFVLTGFRHDAGSRVFEFEGIAADKKRSSFFVSADLLLSRTYGIRVQELPQLCLRLLEQHEFIEQEHALTYAEDDMRLYKTNRTEREEAQKKKAPRRPFAGATQNRLQAFAAAGQA
jgi:hypothetical protein